MKNEKIVKQLETLKKNHTLSAPNEHIKLHISTGNSKMGKVASVSLTPIYTCSNCNACKHDCYALKAYQQYQCTRNAYDGNTIYAGVDSINYFSDINAWLACHKSYKLFRWHVAGDITSAAYFDHMIDTARYNPGVIFWAFTKNYGTVNSWLEKNGGADALPDNLSVIYSGGWNITVDNPHGLAECIVIDDKSEFPGGNDNFLCGGNCEKCGICAHIKPGQKVYIVKN